MSYPASLDDLSTTRGNASDPTSAPDHAGHHLREDTAIQALETKLGINSSADTSSIDYLLKSVLSIDPGHQHTAASLAIALSNLTDVLITSPGDGNGLIFDGASGKWKNSTTSVADSSATVKGVTKLSVAPASPTAPIAVGDNDGRVSTQGENDAQVGDNIDIAVGSGNKFVTQTGLQHSAEVYAADSVGTDAYAITLSPTPTSYTAGMTLRFKAGTANTGAATLAVNGLAATAIVKKLNLPLNTGDILSGQIVQVTYDGTNFQMISPASLALSGLIATGSTSKNLADASTTQNIAHGLGVIPQLFKVTGVFGNSIAHSFNGNSVYMRSVDSGNQFLLSSDGSSVTANYQSGVITADATNLIITWSKVSFPTGTASLIWEAQA